mgnify:FL=1
MKKALWTMFVAIALGLPQGAWAESMCGPNQRFGKIGNTLTADGVITSSAAQVRAFAVTSTTSAGIFGIYDTTAVGLTSATTLVVEPTAAANGTTMLPPLGFFDPPLEFANGITVIGSNMQAATAFGCIDR